MALVLRRIPTAKLLPAEMEQLRAMFTAAWTAKDSSFSEEDFEHACSDGVHFVLASGGEIVSHASVAPRRLHTNGQVLEAGYVEAVATWPHHQRAGHATTVMNEINVFVRSTYELGALSTGIAAFYERLGWELWRGPTFVRTTGGEERTPDDDGGILVLRTPRSAALKLDRPIACEWRTGDVW